MMPKKSKKADLEKKRPIFFQVGLIITLAMILFAFEWKSRPTGSRKLMLEGFSLSDVDEIVVTRSERIQKPPPPALKELHLNITEEIDLGEDELALFDVEGGERVEMPVFDPGVEEPVEDDTPIYFAQHMPDFNGKGLEGFVRFVAENLKYPQEAIDNQISGKVIVRFVVDKSGHVRDVLVLRSAYPVLDREAVRVISASPAWTPGDNSGIPVSVIYTIPVNFTLK